ncbi:MAG: hypothetical protein ACE367_24825 [Acidimicrobiales bacterium]
MAIAAHPDHGPASAESAEESGAADAEAAAPVRPEVETTARHEETFALLVSGERVRVTAEDRDSYIQMHSSIAACMEQKGFRYVVPAAPTPHDLTLEEARRDGLGEREFVSAYGFGISHPDGDTADPNEDSSSGLSRAERRAYDDALYGDPANGGCNVQMEAPAIDQEALHALRSAWAGELASIDADLERSAETAEWSACMEAAGFAFGTRAEMLDVVTTSILVHVGVKAPTGQTIELSGGPDATRPFEVDVATADLDCRARAGYDTVEAELRDRVRAAFLVANAALLDQVTTNRS